MRRCNTDAYGYGFANGYGYSHTDGNAYVHANGDGYGDCHSNTHTDAYGYRDCHGYRDCYGYVHADAYSDANCGKAYSDAAAASNNTAAASVVGSGKWNSSCGNSRVTLASSPPDKSVAPGVPVFGAIQSRPPCELIALRQTAVATLTVAVATFTFRASKKGLTKSEPNSYKGVSSPRLH